MHAGQDFFCSSGQRKLRRGDAVVAQPARAVGQIGHGIDSLAHAACDQRPEHVASSAEVAVDGWEDNLEEPGLAVGGHAGADDGEV